MQATAVGGVEEHTGARFGSENAALNGIGDSKLWGERSNAVRFAVEEPDAYSPAAPAAAQAAMERLGKGFRRKFVDHAGPTSPGGVTPVDIRRRLSPNSSPMRR